jgi:hypothetical protein
LNEARPATTSASEHPWRVGKILAADVDVNEKESLASYFARCASKAVAPDRSGGGPCSVNLNRTRLLCSNEEHVPRPASDLRAADVFEGNSVPAAEHRAEAVSVHGVSPFEGW